MPLCSLSPFEKFKMVLSRISFSRSNIFKPKIRYGQPWVETPPTVLSSVVFQDNPSVKLRQAEILAIFLVIKGITQGFIMRFRTEFALRHWISAVYHTMKIIWVTQ